LDDIANLSPEIKRKRTTTSTNTSSSQHQETQNHHQSYQQQLDELTQQQSNCLEDDELNVAQNVVISNTPAVGSSPSSHM
jgi:lipid II:glycine glycyltransferase (peptidoglycan interpeptide bridge formation enzyme)